MRYFLVHQTINNFLKYHGDSSDEWIIIDKHGVELSYKLVHKLDHLNTARKQLNLFELGVPVGSNSPHLLSATSMEKYQSTNSTPGFFEKDRKTIQQPKALKGIALLTSSTSSKVLLGIASFTSSPSSSSSAGPDLFNNVVFTVVRRHSLYAISLISFIG